MLGSMDKSMAILLQIYFHIFSPVTDCVWNAEKM